MKDIQKWCIPYLNPIKTERQVLRMKKALALALMALILVCAAAFAEEDEFELPEEALEFNNVWVNGEIRIDAYPEDGGFVLEVSEWKDFEAMTGYIWEYKAVYQEEDDTLVTVSALKWPARIVDGEFIAEAVPEYEDGEAAFFIDEDGELMWEDKIDHTADGMGFKPIGRFEGIWPGVNSTAEIIWSDDHYTIYLSVQNEEGKTESYMYTGFYSPETNTLEAYGTCDVITYVDNVETERQEIVDDVKALFYMNADHNLEWSNEMPGGVPGATFDNPNNLMPEDSNG